MSGPDPQVFALAAAGDVGALASLLDWSRSRLVNYAARSCAISDMDDAVQEVLLALSRSLRVLRHVRALTTWMFRVTRRTCHKLARVALRVDLWDDERLAAVVAPLSDDALRLSLARALQSLPPHHLEVVLLCVVEELTIGEIAARLGESRAAVKSRLHRARELAREYPVARRVTIARMRAAAGLALLLLACKSSSSPPAPPPLGKPAAMAHAGLGSSPALADGPKKAVDRALAVLEAGGDPLDAAVAGVVVLENDPRFNAGTGSVVRLDAETVQMDAAVMRSDGRFAAIAAIEGVENPVLVARAVLDTPHLLLVGDGATRFARTLGYGAYDPVTPERKRRAQEIQQQLAASSPALPAAWRSFDWRARWNFAKTPEEAGFPPLPPKAGPVDAGADTVGVVVRAADGRFAAALSTGGTSITLRGRVGDVPIFGCGLFAGTAGASAATGDGEFIIRAALARQIDEWLAAGLSPQEAADRAVKLVAEKGGEAGVLVVGRAGMAVASAKPMAWAARESGATVSFGP